MSELRELAVWGLRTELAPSGPSTGADVSSRQVHAESGRRVLEQTGSAAQLDQVRGPDEHDSVECTASA
jgi:hypothetical protein